MRCLLVLLLLAQDPQVEITPRATKSNPAAAPAAPLPQANIRIDTNVVLVPVNVTDPLNRFVAGLEQADFRVFEDGVEQKILSFGNEDAALSIGIVFDTSGSMGSKLAVSRLSVAEFFKTANPEDEAFLFTVSSLPSRASSFTRDFDTLLSQALFTQAGGSTALVDTIYAAVGQMRSAHHGRRAILVVSDGMDNHSRYSKTELMAAAVEADLQIYTISVFDPPRNKKPIELKEEHDGVFFLEELSKRTGGIQMVVHDSAEAAQAAERMGRVMRDQYLIGYVPERATDNGKWHSIKIAVRAPDARAYARSGYYSK